MPLKFTWKSILGALALLGSVTTQLAHAGLPPQYASVLAAAGAGILAAERVADALDHRTDSTPK